MVDLQVLKRHGVSAADYRKIFADDPAKYKRGVKRLIDTISARIHDGRSLNLKEWRAYCAIDLAYDVPFNQTAPTIIQNILSKRLDLKSIQAELANWGLKEEDLFMKVQVDGKEGIALNAPLFFQVVVPLTKAYVNSVCGNLFNPLNVDPFLPYKPLKETDRNRVVCEAITDLVDTQSAWYGYPATCRQAILQMLKYGICLTFPLEEWHCEKHTQDVTNPLTGLPEERDVIVKEGLRYAIPHPTRMAFDLSYPLTSVNTDSGVEWGFFWRVLNYGQILDNPVYYNRRNIFSGSNWFQCPTAGNYFTEIYPCNVKFPISGWKDATDLREDKSAWYQTTGRDQSVFVSEFFWKFAPKDYDLGDYKYPLWNRFTVAGDDSIIWAKPCAYNPMWFMGWDYDENAGRNSSLGLETIQWQDFFGSWISQIILTAKQNLSKVVFYDTNLVSPEDINHLKNMGENRYRAVQYIGFDSFKTRAMGLGQQTQAFQVPNLGNGPSVVEMLQALPQIISMMERVLMIAAQQQGAQATHQQSRAEIVEMGEAGKNRTTFIMNAVHEGRDAWKRQLYEANIAYRDANFAAEVSADIPDIHKILEDLGFTIVHAGTEKILVHGRKGALKLEGFARTTEPIDQQPDAQVAQTIFSVVSTISSQEDLKMRIGADNLISMLELAAQLAGAPRGFKLKRSNGKEQGGVPQPILQAIQAAQQATLQAVQEKIGQPAAEQMGKEQQQIAQMQQALEQLQGIYQQAQKIVDRDQIKARESQVDQQAKEAEHQLSMRHREEEHAQKLEQDRQKAELGLQVDAAKAEQDIAAKKAQARAQATAKSGKQSA